MCQQCGALTVKSRAEPIAGHPGKCSENHLQGIMGNKTEPTTEDHRKETVRNHGKIKPAARDCGKHPVS